MKQSNKQLYEALIKSREVLNQQIYSTLESLVLGDELEKLTFNENGKFICHLCKGTRTCKTGINSQGKQKYKCHNCKKEMIIQRNIITFSSKKDFSQWMIFWFLNLMGIRFM